MSAFPALTTSIRRQTSFFKRGVDILILGLHHHGICLVYRHPLVHEVSTKPSASRPLTREHVVLLKKICHLFGKLKRVLVNSPIWLRLLQFIVWSKGTFVFRYELGTLLFFTLPLYTYFLYLFVLATYHIRVCAKASRIYNITRLYFVKHLMSSLQRSSLDEGRTHWI